MRNIILLTFTLLMTCGAFAEDSYNYSIEVGQFDKVRVLDNINVVYRYLPDSTGYVQYRGEPNLENLFNFSAKGDGKLKIQTQQEYENKVNLPVVYIYSDFLTSVENSSDSELKVESLAPCAEFKATQIGNGRVVVDGLNADKVIASLNTGNGTVNVAGKCEEAILKMVGTGMIAADRLRAEDVQCKILGTGTIGCWPVKNLSVKGIGSTKIYYKGTPVIKKSGGGKLIELPADESEFNPGVDSDENLSSAAGKKNPAIEKEDEKEKKPVEEEEEPQTVVTLEDD